MKCSFYKYYKYNIRIILFSLVFINISSFAKAQITFTTIPNLPHLFSNLATSVSADGSVVAGVSYNGANYPVTQQGLEAFRWTPTTGIVSLGQSENPMVGIARATFVSDISADGNTIIGTTSENSLFAWTPEKGVVELKPYPASPVPLSYGFYAPNVQVPHISPNGRYIVSPSPPFYNFEEKYVTQSSIVYDTQTHSLVNNTQFPDIVPISVTSDGSITGIVMRNVGLGSAIPVGTFRTPNGAVLSEREFFPDLYAEVVSEDGKVLAGRRLVVDKGYEAFRWTRETGYVSLKDFGFGIFPRVADISADGNIIIGNTSVIANADIIANADRDNFVWTPETGVFSLRSALTESGINTSSWTDWSVRSISADGTTIVGNGRNNGAEEAFVIRNAQGWNKRQGNNIPEPASISLLMLGLGGLIASQARKRMKLR
jgi:hypothetical protein